MNSDRLNRNVCLYVCVHVYIHTKTCKNTGWSIIKPKGIKTPVILIWNDMLLIMCVFQFSFFKFISDMNNSRK